MSGMPLERVKIHTQVFKLLNLSPFSSTLLKKYSLTIETLNSGDDVEGSYRMNFSFLFNIQKIKDKHLK